MNAGADGRTGTLGILELRMVADQGGGPEKTLLEGTRSASPKVRTTLAYLRRPDRGPFWLAEAALAAGLDYVELEDRGPFDPRPWIRASRLVSRRRIDVVHSHDYKTDVLAFFLSRARGVAWVSTVHSLFGASRRERWVYLPLAARARRHCDRVLTVAPAISDAVSDQGVATDRVELLVNGVDAETFRPRPDLRAEVRQGWPGAPDDPVIGVVCRLEAVKRVDLVLDAMVEILSRRPATRLVIVGAGRSRGALEARAEELGLASRCHFLGHRRDVASLLAGLDVLVSASEDEGMPNSLLEAMAAGVPVVATAIPGHVDLVEDGVHGLLVGTGDAAALAAAVERVLADPDAAGRRSRAARDRVLKSHSFTARCLRLEAIYDELLAERHSGGADGRRSATKRR